MKRTTWPKGKKCKLYHWSSSDCQFLSFANQELTTVAGLLSVFSRHETMKIEAINKSDPPNMKTADLSISHSLSYRRISERENSELHPKQASTQLHLACTLPNPFPLVKKLLADGALPNQRNSQGQTPLHVLIIGGIRSPSVKDALECLIWRGACVSCEDDDGNTPLLCLRFLLMEKRYEIAADVAHSLLQAGADVSSVDRKNQTLLSHSLQYLDSSIELTKTLFNHGASVWGPADPGEDDSAFKWLLMGIMTERKLSNCFRSLTLVGQLMGAHPSRMKRLLLRTMTRHSKCYQVYGPLFRGIHLEMKKYWKEPQRLTHLCRLAIRESFQISPWESVDKLSLPKIVKNYLLLQDEISG